MSDFKIDSATTRAAGRPKDPEKRDAILNAAARLFLEHGFDRTSMDAIANAAGVSKLTVYSHFDDKDGLFKELIRHKCDQYFENRDVSQLNDLPPQDALTKMANGFLGLMFNPETLAMYRLLMSNAARDPARNQTFYDTGRHLPSNLCHGCSTVARAWPAESR
ncbi:MAG: TetR/AcrR family transcriptional regulator [Gammaproteobacteria bacterium]